MNAKSLTATPLTADTIVDLLADIFRRRGADSYLGERVTMSQHMLQAAQLAEQAGAPDDLVAAALLHDIGHYTNEFPEDALECGIDNHHDTAGARVLEPLFPTAVTDCVRLHVTAKRYLCAVEPGYFDRLSDASAHTLGLQGGPIEAVDAAAFAANPRLDDIIRVRRWDEAAKEEGKPTPPFDHYEPLLRRVVARHAGGQSFYK